MHVAKMTIENKDKTQLQSFLQIDPILVTVIVSPD